MLLLRAVQNILVRNASPRVPMCFRCLIFNLSGPCELLFLLCFIASWTRGNNKILGTPPPHISSSEEILPRLTRRTLTQFRTNKSPFLKSYLHKVDAKSHPSPLCPLCNTHTHDIHHLFNCTHIRTILSPLDLWTEPTGVTALARVMGLGRQQHKERPWS